MAQSLSKILVHLVFSTKDRQRFIQSHELQTETQRYLAGICRSRKCPSIAVGAVDDHVHLLLNLHRTADIAGLVKELKRSSSLWLKQKRDDLSEFQWQNGYGAFSVGQSQVDDVTGYIAKQREHHRARSFQEEYREFLKKYEVEYDERYVWD